MSRKNVKYSDNSDVFVFDQRTKAVMAQPAQDGIKEKVQSVREVVPGHSNNEITLVLQYYDYSVERAIQAYVDDGAKEALQEWHFPGNKDKEKKKKQLKKKKVKEQKEKETNEAEETVKPAVAVENVVLNGDILSNGTDLSQDTTERSLNEVDLLAPPSGATNLPGAPSAPSSKANSNGLTTSTTALETNSHNRTSDIRVTATNSHESLPQRGKGGGNRERGAKGKTPAANSGPPAPNAATQKTSKPESSKSTTATPSVVVSAPSSSAPTFNSSSSLISAATSSQNKEPSSQSSAASHNKSSDASSAGTVTSSTGAVVRPTSQQKYQSRPKTLDGWKGRDRAASERSGSGTSTTKEKPAPTIHLNTKRPYAGLEKSVKDLHRQTLALTRIKMMSADEMERCYKRINHVFEDLHTAMNEREADVIYQMDKVKEETNKTLAERQKRAAELKKRTERAASMSDSEVGELRHDIKVFVSDRKIDEELGSTQRFQCAAEDLMRLIRSFGEVIGVRSAYGQRRNSVSSVSSSCVSHDDLMSPSTPMTPMTPITPATPSTNGLSLNTANPPLPRVFPTKLEELEETPKSEPVNEMYAKEIAEMQEKFQAAFKAPSGVKKSHSANSSTGVSSMSSNSLPETPVSTDSCEQSLTGSSTTSSPQNQQSAAAEAVAAKKSRNARRRQMQKERDRKYRDEYRHSQGQKNAPSANPPAEEKNASSEKSTAEQKPEKQQEKPRSKAPPGGKQSQKSGKTDGTQGPKPQNESRSQSQPGRRFDGRRDRSASTRGRPQQGGYNRGSSPSKRGGSNQRFQRGGFQGGNRQGAHANQDQHDQKSTSRGPRPEGQGFKGQSRDRRGQGYQQNRNNFRDSKSTTKDNRVKINNAKDSSNQTVNSAKTNGDLNNSPKDTPHTRDNVHKKVDSLPKKELETVPESKKESSAASVKREPRVENEVEKNNNIDKKPSVPPQSNGPKSVNNNNKEEKSNSSHNHKVDENSNHRKSSATVRLTNNGNVPHEVSINDAPIVKKSIVSVEEVTRKQEMGLPQRKPRLREIRRAEVIVNGDMNGIVNGHVEE